MGGPGCGAEKGGEIHPRRLGKHAKKQDQVQTKCHGGEFHHNENFDFFFFFFFLHVGHTQGLLESQIVQYNRISIQQRGGGEPLAEFCFRPGPFLPNYENTR